VRPDAVVSALLAGVLAGLGVAVPVGAVAVCLVTLTARTSLRVGASAGLGVATADGAYALLAVVGGAALAARLEAVAGPVRTACAVVLLAVAGALVRSSLRPAGDVDARSGPTPLRAYAGLLALTLLNPLTVVLFTALVVGRSAGAAVGAGDQALFVGGVLLASSLWHLLLVAGGAALGRSLTGPRGRLLAGLCSATLLTVLAVRLLLAS